MANSHNERFVEIAGGKCRIWEKGDGAPIGVIAGLKGFPRWSPFLEALARTNRVTAVSAPGFWGSDANHEELDNHVDWISATLDLLEHAKLEHAPLVAGSVAGIVAADVAAMAPGFISRLSLTGPFGLYDSAVPTTDVFAQTPAELTSLLVSDTKAYSEQFAEPTDPEAAAEYQLRTYRNAVASARVSWPFGDRGLAKRLHRIRIPVQLIWGSNDRVVPSIYAEKFKKGLSGPCQIEVVEGAGHLAWIDRPNECADRIAKFANT
jgi:pimeloyl-ACP methyl ester carboxylesterase